MSKQCNRCTSGYLVSLDANGNNRRGTTTTDSNGQYNFAWIPDISGAYTVYVTFAGSEAYFGSLAGSAFVVDQPVATATPQPTQPASAADKYFVPAIAGLFVLVIIVLASARSIDDEETTIKQ